MLQNFLDGITLKNGSIFSFYMPRSNVITWAKNGAINPAASFNLSQGAFSNVMLSNVMLSRVMAGTNK